MIYSATAQRHLEHCCWGCRPKPVMEGLVRKWMLEAVSEWAVLSFIYWFRSIFDSRHRQIWPTNCDLWRMLPEVTMISSFVVILDGISVKGWWYICRFAAWCSSRVGSYCFFFSWVSWYLSWMFLWGRWLTSSLRCWEEIGQISLSLLFL